MSSNNKGVIINVYVESDKQNDPIKKIIPNLSLIPPSKSRAFKARGYDRRAQLLAYVHKLRRHANAQHKQYTFNNSTRKHKKWRWLLPVQKVRVCFSSRFEGIKRRWNKYEPIVTEEYYSDDGDQGWCNVNQDGIKATKTRFYSHFCKKLRCFLKEISRSCRCKNGGC